MTYGVVPFARRGSAGIQEAATEQVVLQQFSISVEPFAASVRGILALRCHSSFQQCGNPLHSDGSKHCGSDEPAKSQMT
jgi:hypothetical protein